MADEYIKKATVLDIICKHWRSKMYADDAIQAALDEIGYHVPSADVAPVRHGRWKKKHNKVCYWHECSECGIKAPKDQWKNEWKSAYCPNCGSRMDKQEGSAEYDPDKFFGRKK